jgi:hypothetical protein
MAKQYRYFELENDERIIHLDKNISGNTSLYDIYIKHKEVSSGIYTYVLCITKKGAGTAAIDEYTLLGKIPPDTGA